MQSHKSRGLILDDFLWGIHGIRKDFNLRTPKFGLREIEQYPGASDALERVISGTVKRHGSEIYSKPDPLISEISRDIHSERIATEAYSGWRISPDWVGRALGKVLERALQTVAQLPSQDPKQDYSPKRLKSLASHFRKLSEEANLVPGQRESLGRIWAYFRENGQADRDRLMRVAEQMRWAAETLEAVISRTTAVKSKMDSPNPQVRFALYMAGWSEACTGREQYEPLATLIGAAFFAHGKETPKWTDRLAVEMHYKRERRKRHVEQHLLSRSPSGL